ncbi:PucR family transcriptional regulator [Williamsia herbipolensis]|uniref:PucR family transcriptional regulator n=1 Tax=Williamsia herbipolensis TaxID=1603258 RepID=UPI0005F7C193|nr:helix-turn-helix domain-containing protein [Williamsia herbipolensis]
MYAHTPTTTAFARPDARPLAAIGFAVRELLRGRNGATGIDADIKHLGVRISCAAMTLVGSRRTPAPAHTPGHLESAIAAAAMAAVADAEEFEPAVADDDIAQTIASAVAMWTRDGIDLSAILSVVGSAFDTVVRAVTEPDGAPSPDAASDDGVDRAQTLRALSLLIDIRGRVISIVTRAFVAEADHELTPPTDSPRESFVTEVLAGRMHVHQSAEFGVAPAERYQVLALVADADAPTWRRLRTVVADVLGDRALCLLGARGGTVIVPLYRPDDAVDTDTVEALRGAMGADVTCTSVVGGPTEVPRLAAEADELLELARAIGKPPGLYGLADLVIEYQVTRPGPARDRLAAMIRPLEDNAQLLETLRIHMSCGLNRRETARRLSIHPNTVDNRMTKVSEAIGLDLSRPRSIAQTQSAILAFDAAGAAH